MIHLLRIPGGSATSMEVLRDAPDVGNWEELSVSVAKLYLREVFVEGPRRAGKEVGKSK